MNTVKNARTLNFVVVFFFDFVYTNYLKKLVTCCKKMSEIKLI